MHASQPLFIASPELVTQLNGNAAAVAFDDAIVSHTQVIKTVYLRGGLFAADDDTFFVRYQWNRKKKHRRRGCPTNGSSTVVAREKLHFFPGRRRHFRAPRTFTTFIDLNSVPS